MIDYQDEEEKQVNNSVRSLSGVEVKSLFTYEEVGTAFKMNALSK